MKFAIAFLLLTSCLLAQRTGRATQAIRAELAKKAAKADSIMFNGQYATLEQVLLGYLRSNLDTCGFLRGDSTDFFKVKANAFKMPTGAEYGYYLKSDAAGNGTWADVSGVVIGTLWEYDESGAVMPRLSGSEDDFWEYDGNGDLMPTT